MFHDRSRLDERVLGVLVFDPESWELTPGHGLCLGASRPSGQASRWPYLLGVESWERNAQNQPPSTPATL